MATKVKRLHAKQEDSNEPLLSTSVWAILLNGDLGFIGGIQVIVNSPGSGFSDGYCSAVTFSDNTNVKLRVIGVYGVRIWIYL